jgi:27-O-demethylrifamycin SV methyltransferase
MLDKRADIYNDLVKWEKKKELYPIHKKLLPFTYNKKICKDVNDVLLQQPVKNGEKMLDIGCGVGNTLISFATLHEIEGLGISISSDEVMQANENLLKADLKGRINFSNQSFDEPIAFSFDKAFAIESLKHSFDIDNTAANIYASANPGAQIFIIDDFYKGVDEQYDFASMLKKDWNLSHLYSGNDFENAFVQAGFIKVGNIDFSDHVIPKSIFILKLQIFIFSVMERLSGSKSKKHLLAIFKSGFILELLFQRKLFSYECLIFRKPAEPDEHLGK